MVGTAIIIGASSGIGEALARQLAAEGWRLGLAARRIERLDAIAHDFPGAMTQELDLTRADAAMAQLDGLIEALGGADLIVLSSGTGHLNPALAWDPDRETLAVNVTGFAAAAQVAMRHFLRRGRGHLVGITSVGALRGNADGAAYCASKAFQSIYLDGLRELAARSRLPITVTEAQPGFVRTAMMKAERPFWIASPETAAAQIRAAIRRRAKHVYITRRWGLVALIARLLPRPG